MKQITISDELIKKNLEAVEKGEALTMPLSILDGQFKKAYFHKNKFVPKKLNCVICSKTFRQKIYNQITCSKKCRLNYKKAYKKAYMKAYYQKPEVKAYKKAYYQKNKNKINKQRRERYLEHKKLK